MRRMISLKELEKKIKESTENKQNHVLLTHHLTIQNQNSDIADGDYEEIQLDFQSNYTGLISSKTFQEHKAVIKGNPILRRINIHKQTATTSETLYANPIHVNVKAYEKDDYITLEIDYQLIEDGKFANYNKRIQINPNSEKDLCSISDNISVNYIIE